MATISSLVVSLKANSAQLVSELAKSRKKVSSWAKNVRSTANTVGKAFVASAVAVGAAIVAIVNGQAAEIDKLAKKAAALQIDTGDLQKLRYQAELSGVSTDGLDKSLTKMLKTVSDGKAGLSTAVRAFDELGLSADSLSNLSTDQQFYAIAEAMTGVESQADRTRIAMDIFGRSGGELLNTFKSDLSGVGEEFDSLGVSLTKQQAQIVENFNDSKTKLSTIWDGFLNQVTVRVAPAFQELINYITETTASSGGMGKVAVGVMESIASAAAFIADGFRGVKLVITTAWLGITKLSAMLIETVRSLESVYIDIMALVGKEIKPSVSLKLDAEAEKMKIGEMQKQIDEMLNGELASTKVKKYFSGLNDRMNSIVASQSVDDVTKRNTDTTQRNTAATEQLNSTMKGFGATGTPLKTPKQSGAAAGSTGSSAAWEKVFGKQDDAAEKNLKISHIFSDYAKALNASINRGDKEDIIYFTEQLQRTIDGLAGRGPTGLSFGSDRTYDIDGMQSVLDRLVDKMTETPKSVGTIDINVATDSKTISGKLMGDPAFLKQLKSFIDNQTNSVSKAVAN